MATKCKDQWKVSMETTNSAWLLFWTIWIFLAGVLQATVASEDDVTARISFTYNAEGRSVREFSVDGVYNYSTLLLSPDENKIYVGARENIFSLSLDNISVTYLQKTLTWSTPERKRKECIFKGKDPQTDCFNYIKILLRLNSTHLYVCGTYAFSPICAYINISSFSLERDEKGEHVMEDGRGRCPFNPESRSTAITVDGELYTATVSNFQGNEPTIYRSLGSGTPLKTENSLNWLQDPAFVGSAHITGLDSERSDDQIYFFFSEMGKEFDFFDNTIVSRIARVCKEDQGGERVLQKKWTTFLKAQLLCSLPDDGFPFNIIQDVYVLPAQRKKNTLLYAVFTSQWSKGLAGSSAVCVFSMDQVEKAFNGRYKEVNRETQQWYTHTHSVPEPRPGMCITNASRQLGIDSSLDMPDKVLNFVKDHFLMDSPVKSRPVLFTHSVHYTQIAVHHVQGLHEAYDVMFIGTDDGRLQKAVNVDGIMHIIEEIQLFPEQQPVQNIELDSTKGLLFVSSHSGIVQLPVANCSFHNNCGECVLARDPYCAWTGTHCTDVTRIPPQNQWQQDIEKADTLKCNSKMLSVYSESSVSPRSFPSSQESDCVLIIVPANTLRLLLCNLRSNHAQRKWSYKPDVGHFLFPSPEGGLVVSGRAGSDEVFSCWSEEHGFRQLLANYCVKAEPLSETTTNTGQMDEHLIIQSISSDVLSSESARAAQLRIKTYGTELAVVCVLLAVCVLSFGLSVAYRHRGWMKEVLRGGEQTGGAQKSTVRPGESLPLNAGELPTSPSDHKSYQTLEDNCGYTIAQSETSTQNNSKEAQTLAQMPQNGFKETHVEVSDISPRPRVRLGSEIRDSVV
ncbi:semaphorin-4B-like [Sinocyclocheilus rhinocerous]|uniref:semaphorin-4B-like n=1 Tax=Sinocyclocheilus rhinocerous TaxID=307959 RepID=UPI0007B83AED|nr:PREDICTED: semaphorin-4B-like [Sinocyclocheilus rhinocerous]XP_016421395.1 PREDICTED: semaphorin-4B-like [Sinocyclocheilus rhinocerous]